MRRTTAFRAGIWIAVGLSVLDIAGVLTVGMEQAPSAPVIVAGAGLGVMTLLAIRPAVRGNRNGLTTVVGSRVFSALLSIPAFFTGTTSAAAAVVATTLIALTALAIALLAPALRSPAVQPVPAS